MSKKQPVILEREEKLAYVEQILLKKKTVTQVAQEAEVRTATVYDWLKKYRDNPKDFMPGRGNQLQVDKQIKDLEKENKELRKEIEFLKKAAAYFIKDPL